MTLPVEIGPTPRLVSDSTNSGLGALDQRLLFLRRRVVDESPRSPRRSDRTDQGDRTWPSASGITRPGHHDEPTARLAKALEGGDRSSSTLPSWARVCRRSRPPSEVSHESSMWSTVQARSASKGEDGHRSLRFSCPRRRHRHCWRCGACRESSLTSRPAAPAPRPGSNRSGTRRRVRRQRHGSRAHCESPGKTWLPRSSTSVEPSNPFEPNLHRLRPTADKLWTTRTARPSSCRRYATTR